MKNNNYLWSKTMKSVKYWEHIILSNKNVEPISPEDKANFEIALYFISHKYENKAA